MNHKICLDCDISKPLDKFYGSPRGALGTQPYCKSCELLRKKMAYQKNREKRIIYQRQWNKDNPTKCQAYKRSAQERKKHRQENIYG